MSVTRTISPTASTIGIKPATASASDHLFPQDVKVQELGTGRTRVEHLIELGIGPTSFLA